MLGHRETEWHGREKTKVLGDADMPIRRVDADVRGAALDGLEYLRRRVQLARPKDLQPQPPAAHGLHALRDAVDAGG